MTHMVIYRSVDNQTVFHQVESLEDAARHVETLRNAGQGGDARIFRMEEVKIAVKTYYRVEVAVDEPQAAASDTPAVAEPAQPAPVAATVAADPAPAPAAAPAPAETATSPAAAPAGASTVAAVKPETAGAGANGAGGRFGLFGKS